MAKTDEDNEQRLSLPSSCPPWMMNALSHLMQRHGQGRFPHALLLSGAAELGKTWFAEYLVRALSCREPVDAQTPCGQCTACAQLSVGSSSEFRYLKPAGKSVTIRIDPVRELVEWLQLSANADRYRIALITGADTLNRAAANALLKTLEEPAARSLLILVADKPAQLPATVISRCQKLNLSVEDTAAAVTWLQAQLPNGIDASAALAAASAAPLRAIRESESDWRSVQETIDAAWWNLLMHKRSVGAIVESLKDVPLTDCLARFLVLAGAGIRMREGAGRFSPGISFTEEQSEALNRLNTVQWFTIHDQLQRLYRIGSASFKTQTVLEGFLADTRLKING